MNRKRQIWVAHLRELAALRNQLPIDKNTFSLFCLKRRKKMQKEEIWSENSTPESWSKHTTSGNSKDKKLKTSTTFAEGFSAS